MKIRIYYEKIETMLIRFIVKNFKSFKDETEFNMLPNKGKGYSKHNNHVFEAPSGVRILKTAAIYGANASGKSNLTEALIHFKNIILENPNGSPLMPMSQRFKVDKSYKTKPTSFRIEYLYDDIHFDYAIEVNKGKITEEWLYQIEDIKKEKEKLLFSRKDDVVSFGKTFTKSDISYLKQYIKKELKENQSVLNASFERIDKNKTLDKVFKGLNNLTIISPDSFNTNYISSILTGENDSDFASKILKNAETGVEKLTISEIDSDTFFSYEEEDFKNELIDRINEAIENEDVDEENVVVSFGKRKGHYALRKRNEKYTVSILKSKHLYSDELFDLDEESDGTNRLLELTPAFDDLINSRQNTYIIDELERSMHPLLAKELVRLFSESNTINSQLIFTTHESQLLDLNLFRQDEIWFTEKKQDGSTEFYPLSKFKPREDKDIRKGYLQGRYGGIPFLGDFINLKNSN